MVFANERQWFEWAQADLACKAPEQRPARVETLIRSYRWYKAPEQVRGALLASREAAR